MIIKKKDSIFVAGHNGLVGSSIIRELKLNSFKNILTVNKKELNLLDQKKVLDFLRKKKNQNLFL